MLTYHWTFGISRYDFRDTGKTEISYIEITLLKNAPRPTEEVITACDSWLIENAEANGAFLTILDGQSEAILQADLRFWCDDNSRSFVIIITGVKSLQFCQVVARNKARV